jgi:hypothetical protein
MRKKCEKDNAYAKCECDAKKCDAVRKSFRTTIPGARVVFVAKFRV